MIIRTLAKLIALLNSNRRAAEVGAAIAFGFWIALVPATNLIFAALVLVVFLVKVNLGMAIVSALVLSLVVPALDPLLNRLGEAILLAPGLEPVFTRMADMPVVPWTRFNDTLVMGTFVGGAVAFVPVMLLAVLLVHLYRKHVHAKIANSKIVKAFMATPFVQKLVRALRGVRRVWPASV
jgi:uncharacterized protein (TIGR03546 family)